MFGASSELASVMEFGCNELTARGLVFVGQISAVVASVAHEHFQDASLRRDTLELPLFTANDICNARTRTGHRSASDRTCFMLILTRPNLKGT